MWLEYVVGSFILLTVTYEADRIKAGGRLHECISRGI